ncbi:hypothetical protein J3458_019487 [Metarhizium acridum]|uniref:uncharacterized protein n=1 Tax=Metarhizium acridum TaxID=92637 RepID=UPI001C6B5584|nr:hypothetical protein J3458_019487 [Metarhizium acridum]
MLLLWTFEIQLLMQIIVNRIAIIAEHQDTVTRLKWGTAFVITCINIAVFCIWIPSHIVPPASELYVKINEIWDRISKVLILLVDAGLNYYFLRTVKRRLVLRHGLTKYAPLVAFNARLMVVSILMDVSFGQGVAYWSYVAAQPNRLYTISPGHIHGEAEHSNDNGRPDYETRERRKLGYPSTIYVEP